ncbi:MAG TPA: OsmC family protein, partial [Actinomycetes bacterium]|nr:OsmC family protein [Actinomycetes bacterium]
ASVSSCFALAVAWSARRLGVDIGEPGDLTVTAVGEYDGASYAAITITVATGSREPAELDRVLKEAQRVCYVTNTLRRAPDLTFTLAP